MAEHQNADNVTSRRKSVIVKLPPGLPQPTPEGWRILLEILIELSTERESKFDRRQQTVVRNGTALRRASYLTSPSNVIEAIGSARAVDGESE
jgi:hypothetical protein